MDRAIAWFLDDSFWLPKGTKFEDWHDEPGAYYPKARDLSMMLALGVLFLLLRWVFEQMVALPLCDKLGIKNQRKTVPTENDHLEKLYKRFSKPAEKEIIQISKQTDLSIEEIQRWLRRRRNLDRPDLRKKFAETFWRFFFYSAVFVFGTCTVVRTPWFWDTYQCWKGYPKQPLWPSVYCYYMLEGGFYFSLVFSIVKDVRRKDFAEQMIHHVATIFLIAFSYLTNFVRIGTLVMVTHDISDVILEGAKCTVYAKYDRLADNLFTIFATVFITSRLIVFPFCVLHTSWVKAAVVLDTFPSYYFFNGLLLVLQLLHVFWASIIIRMAIKMHKTGSVEKDARSDEEEESSDEDQSPPS